MINNIEKGIKFEYEIIKKYKTYLPEELIELWENYGLAKLFNGYIKVINPDNYKDLLNDSYFRGNISIPIFVTGFGDIITIEEGEYIGIIRFKNGNFNIVAKNIKRFLQNINDEYFQNKYFELNQYEKAVNRLGELEDDECFGYVPLLGLGGSEKVENLQKVKIKEHIELITQLVGKIE